MHILIKHNPSHPVNNFVLLVL